MKNNQFLGLKGADLNLICHFINGQSFKIRFKANLKKKTILFHFEPILEIRFPFKGLQVSF